jgi:glycerol-3-phosphate acyltransferase PlsY
MVLHWIGALFAGYTLGSIPTGVLVSRWFRRTDPRKIGSGRTGGTNVLRAAGWQAAVLTALGDGVKAALAVLVAGWLAVPPLARALAGSAAVAGHNYSLFLRFRGGAGTAASIGGALALWPWSIAVLVPVGLAVVVAARRASLGSIVVAVVLPAIFAVRAALGVGPWEYLLYGLLTSALALWSLRPNIKRLLQGKERKIDLQAGRRNSGAKQRLPGA